VKARLHFYILRWQVDGCEVCNRSTGELDTVTVNNGRFVGRCSCSEQPEAPWTRCPHQEAVLRRFLDRTFAALFTRWKKANPGRIRRLPNQRADDPDEPDPNFEIYPLPKRRYEVRDRRRPEAHVLDVSARRWVGKCDCGLPGELPLFMCPHRLALRAYLLNLPCNRRRELPWPF